MILRLVSGAAGPVLEADLPPDHVAYMDGEWLLARPGAALPALVVDLADGTDAEATAARALARVARDSVAEVTALAPTGPVEVTGGGAVATLTRSFLGDAAATSSESARPAAVIDTTGDPELIADATRRVADLGLVVLAGESAGRRLDLDLYPDVHVRGLVLAGVKAACIDGADTVVELPPLPPAAEVVIGAPLPPRSVWYRVTRPAAG